MAERREPEPECNPNPNVTLTLTLTPREEGLGFNTGFGLEGYASLEIDGIQMLFPTGSLRSFQKLPPGSGVVF